MSDINHGSFFTSEASWSFSIPTKITSSSSSSESMQITFSSFLTSVFILLPSLTPSSAATTFAARKYMHKWKGNYYKDSNNLKIFESLKQLKRHKEITIVNFSLYFIFNDNSAIQIVHFSNILVASIFVACVFNHVCWTTFIHVSRTIMIFDDILNKQKSKLDLILFLKKI